MTRVLLINLIDIDPEREHIDTVDRAQGEMFFASLGLEYAGYIQAETENCLAAQWLVPQDKLEATIEFVKSHNLEGYAAQVFASRPHPNGSIEEVRVA